MHLVAGFGRITDIAGASLLTDLTGADDVLAGEEGAVEHMNDDHADAILLYATKLLGAAQGEWRMTGTDPEGADLMLGRSTLRLPFPARVNDMKALQKTLVALVGEARTRP